MSPAERIIKVVDMGRRPKSTYLQKMFNLNIFTKIVLSKKSKAG
jgi:hypothetical protein